MNAGHRMRLLPVLTLLLVAVGALHGNTSADYDAQKLRSLGLTAGRLADAAGIYNDRIAAQVAASGRYNFGAYPGAGSATESTNSFSLSYHWPGTPSSSYATVRIDGTDNRLGDSSVQPSAQNHAGNQSQTDYRLGDVAVSQRLTLVRGPSSGQMDTVAIAYTLTNAGTASHSVGLRVMIDTMLDGNDAAPFRVPGVGALTTQHEFTGAQIPSFWQAFRDLSEPAINAQGTLIGNGATPPDRLILGNYGILYNTPWDVTISPDAANGDSAVAVYWNPVTLAPNQSRTFTTLYGLGQQTVAPSGSLRLGVTAPAIVDLGSSTVFDVVALIENPTNQTVPAVSAVLTLPEGFASVSSQSRSEITIALGDLPAGSSQQVTWRVSAAGAAVGDHALGVTVSSTDASIVPSVVERQITVQGGAVGAVDATRSTLVATRPVALADGESMVELLLTLRDGSGAALAGVPAADIYVSAGGQSAVVSLADSSTDSAGRMTAYATSTVAGPVTFACTASGVTLAGSAPACFVANPVQVTYHLTPGLNLLSQPLSRVTTSSDALSSLLNGLGVVTWDAAAGAYTPFDLTADGGAMGRGFWVRSPDTRDLTIAGVPAVVAGSGAALSGGTDLLGEWNLLGNPLAQTMAWRLSALKVIVDGEVKGTLDQPATWAWVDPYGYVFRNGAYELVFDNTWSGFEGVRASVDTGAGFWLRRTPSTSAVRLSVDVDALAGGSARSVGRGWAISLAASDGDSRSTVTVGANSRLARPLNLQSPPSTSGVPLLTVSGDGQQLRGRLLPSADAASFDLTVNAAAGREVTLAWPGLARELPDGRTATLLDLATGRSLALANRAAYRFAADGTPRRLRLVLSPRGAGRPVLSVAAQSGSRAAGAGITVTVSAPAEVTVEVRGLGGRLVRELAAQTVQAGSTTLLWDGRDAAGHLVPAGVYQLVATAIGADGSLTRAQTTLSR